MDQNVLDRIANMSPTEMAEFREFLKSKIDFLREVADGEESVATLTNILLIMHNMQDEDLKEVIHIGAGFVGANGENLEKMFGWPPQEEPTK